MGGEVIGAPSMPLPRVLPFHRESVCDVQAANDALFAYLDDHTRLSVHMSSGSWMMLGSRMDISLDAAKGQTVGARIRLHGRVLGIPLAVEEVVIERQPPLRKTWQTVGDPNLLVIGHYRMGFELSPRPSSVSLRVFLDYALPSSWPQRWLGRLLGGLYARWCTEHMTNDAKRYFLKHAGRQ
jgi:hypothetical protein